MSSLKEATGYQPDQGTVRWKTHFRSAPSEVYRALATSEGRSTYWAESAIERDGIIHFIVPGGLECDGRILERVPDEKFVVEYFGGTVAFELETDSAGTGTDLQLTFWNMPESDRMEFAAGWATVLLTMKAAVDFSVDLRNHDPDRTWWQGYADN